MDMTMKEIVKLGHETWTWPRKIRGTWRGHEHGHAQSEKRGVDLDMDMNFRKSKIGYLKRRSLY